MTDKAEGNRLKYGGKDTRDRTLLFSGKLDSVYIQANEAPV